MNFALGLKDSTSEKHKENSAASLQSMNTHFYKKKSLQRSSTACETALLHRVFTVFLTVLADINIFILMNGLVNVIEGVIT